ncbi:hypothetical protein C8R48DRAFT_692908, partial [Suillus tomentosus]
KNPQFAFLSACHTTVGDEKSHDESIHLAAAIAFLHTLLLVNICTCSWKAIDVMLVAASESVTSLA